MKSYLLLYSLHLVWGLTVWNSPNNRWYICHCADDQCMTDGTCIPGYQCVRGWFGPACQYKDLATEANITLVPAGLDTHLLTDGNDTTCVNVTSAALIWGAAHYFTWLRITSHHTASGKTEIELELENNSTTIKCSNITTYTVSKTTRDIVCRAGDISDKLIIRLPAGQVICSLFISGGRNVAFNQTAAQTSDYSKSSKAGNAVDGNTQSLLTKGSCTHTASTDKNPSWNVTFVLESNIHTYVLYNRNINQERLQNFALTSGVNKDPSFTYTENSGQTKSIYQISTSARPASYVKISAGGKSDKKILTLCEVFIFGDSICGGLKYGPECSKMCNCLDEEEVCFVATGGCASGCAAGFLGEDCQTECSQGKWGKYCQNNCSQSCLDPLRCDVTSGYCSEGCVTGYIQPKCEQACGGTWGINCSMSCSSHCGGDKSCDPVNGTCNSGCVDGYTGAQCDQECVAGSWGKHCQNNCSRHCIDPSRCDVIRGTCTGGCVAGYIQPTCEQECAFGKWGTNCQNECSEHCLETSNCAAKNGACMGGCSAGYIQPTCGQACGFGTWGINCSMSCSSHCRGDKSCDPVNGSCNSGCVDGYTGAQCDQECPFGRWGINCKNYCSRYCRGPLYCDATSGACKGGCIDGYLQPLCQQEKFKSIENTEWSAISIGIGIGIGVVVTCVIFVLAAAVLYRRGMLSLRRKLSENEDKAGTETEINYLSDGNNTYNEVEDNKASDNLQPYDAINLGDIGIETSDYSNFKVVA